MATFGTTAQTFGGVAIDRAYSRNILPNTRWLYSAAGLVDPGDANIATLSLVYEKDDGSFVTLGSITASGSGVRKRHMGPFDLFATGGVPSNELIPVVRLRAIKDAGLDGTVESWTIMLRLLPSKQ